MSSIELPDGRELLVRPAVEEDVPGLDRLFGSLSPLDRHRRFFSGFRPDAQFLEHLVRAPERDGGCLVAEVRDSRCGSEIVAEADFAPLPDGDAEMSIVVAEGWRGWLAAFLLDALVRLAASKGIANLQAEILTLNRPMLSLVRARGFATLDHEDLTTVRATISTTGRVPSWPGGGRRPRVLIEIPGAHWRHTGAVRAAGFDVIACPGPDPGRPRCPLLRGEDCPLVSGADVVVYALRPTDPGAAELLAAHGRSIDDRPLLIEIRSTDPPLTEQPGGAVELHRPTAEQVVEALRVLIGEGP